MKHGKLSEGVYKLTVSSSGRTLVRAKMVKAIACKVKEVVEPERTEDVAQDARWYSGCELLTEYGIPAHRLYGYREQIKRYIAKPDGVHYRYHEAMLSDSAVMELLTKPVRYRNTSKRGVAAEILARLKANAELAIAADSAPVPVVAAAPAQPEESTEIAPIKVERKVYCKELDRTYDSITLAAKAIGTRREALSKALRAGQRCRGYTFTYVTEEHKEPALKQDKGTGCIMPRKVFCEETGSTFDSIAEAAKTFGVHPKTLSRALKDGKRCKNHSFTYVDSVEPAEIPRQHTRPVYCKELDRTFPSVSAAAKAVNRSVPTLIGAIKHDFLCGGYHFIYA